MKEKILGWLESSGYPLELHVNKTFRERNYIQNESRLYLDGDTSREIDAVAIRYANVSSEYTSELKVIVECKKSINPFVILIEDSRMDTRANHLYKSQNFLDGNNSFNEFKSVIALNKIDNDLSGKIGPFANLVMAGYSIVQAFSNTDSNIYKGIVGLTKAKNYFKEEHIEYCEEYKKDEDWLEHYQTIVPVIVVDAPLFEVYIDNEGKTILKESEWGTIIINKPWKGAEKEKINIQVVRKEFFSDFLEGLERLHDFSSQEFIVNASLK